MKNSLSLGLDLATSTGYAVIDSDESLLDFGVVDLGYGKPHPIRFINLYKEIRKLIKKHNPRIVIVEELHCGRNVNSTKLLGGFLAVVVIAIPRKVKFYTCHQGTAKSEIVRRDTGISKPTKRDVFNWATNKYGLSNLTFEKHSDITDAILVSLWGVNKLTIENS